MKSTRKLALAFGIASILGVAGAASLLHANSNRFGAIAYSQSSGRFGSGWSGGDQSDAVELALASCNRRDCRTVVWFRNGCGALARAGNGAITWAWSGSLVDAKWRASNQCTREWGSCKLICSVCSGGDAP